MIVHMRELLTLIILGDECYMGRVVDSSQDPVEEEEGGPPDRDCERHHLRAQPVRRRHQRFLQRRLPDLRSDPVARELAAEVRTSRDTRLLGRPLAVGSAVT